MTGEQYSSINKSKEEFRAPSLDEAYIEKVRRMLEEKKPENLKYSETGEVLDEIALYLKEVDFVGGDTEKTAVITKDARRLKEQIEAILKEKERNIKKYIVEFQSAV